MVRDPIERPNITSTAFFFGGATILILVALTMTIGNSIRTPTIKFGNCEMTTEIARTSQQKAKGLSNRAHIEQDYAMLFPYNNEEPYFWMKDMFFPIDIVWVKAGHVVKIDANAPADNGVVNYLAPGKIDWVIEVASGRAALCGVINGAKIEGLRS